MYSNICQCLINADKVIQFELRPENRDPNAWDYIQAQEPNYFPTVVSRASSIFEVTFNPDEQIDILCIRFGKRRNRISQSEYWMKNIFCINKKNIIFRKPLRYNRNLWVRKILLSTSRASINHKAIFQAIAHQDFNIQPSTSDLLYFTNIERGLALHMYDDRGLWIASNMPENLPTLDSKIEELVIERANKSVWPLY